MASMLCKLRLSLQSTQIDTPTAGSGGILASTPFAWCPRSYIGSTSVLLLGMPCREVCNTDLMTLTASFIRLELRSDIGALGFRYVEVANINAGALYHTKSEFGERIVSKTRRCQIHPPAISRGLSLAFL